ncbi:protein of unknown function [Polaromonas sp. JS666]|nr:protein of unknown function [Polaromonas sp. JS666]
MARSARRVVAAEPGSANGGVRLLLRAEGLMVLAASVAAYAQFGAGWGWFAALFLLPDLSFAAYLAGPRWGALAYNAAHSYLGAVGLLAVGVLGASPLLLAAALVWCAHIGFDRLLGYGLKYGAGFGHTHLGRLGPQDPW